MTPPTPLAEILYARWSPSEGDPPRSPELDESVERALASMVEAARQAWPDVSITPAAFVGYLVDRLAPGHGLVAGLRRLRGSDLYLACACSMGDVRAIMAFEAAHLTAVDAVLERMGIEASIRDEVIQDLRDRFFVANDGEPPSIARYSGSGDLRRWVRVTAVRTAFRAARERKQFATSDDSVLEALAAPAQDLELDFLKRTYGKAFDVALRAAFDSLPARDRNLLRYHFAKELSIDDLAVLYRIHRATAARRIQKVTTDLAAGARDALAKNLGISGSEVSSLLRLIQSEIERTMTGMLGDDRPT